MPKKHAKLSPSAAARWLTCTAAPGLEASYPEEDSPYAAEGTLAHEFAEMYGKKAMRPGYSMKRKRERLISSVYYDPEMEAYAQEYAAFIKKTTDRYALNTGDALTEFEVKLSLAPYVPKGFGTADCAILADGILHVVDYKYGKGVRVSPEHNPQMMLYALGAYLKYQPLYDYETVAMTIYQPRLNAVETWETSIQDLLTWADATVTPKAAEAWEGPGRFCPSEEACRFCKARGECRARAEGIVELFEETPAECIPALSLEELGALLEKAKPMKAWLADLEAAVYGHLMDGTEVPGWKLVAGRSNRKIEDEVEAAKRLKAAGLDDQDLYIRKFLTITQIEKKLGKQEAQDLLQDLIVKPKGQPTLAPVSDKRESWSSEEAVLDAFSE